MNKSGEWRLAPAFDLTYAYDSEGRWTKVHQLMLGLKQGKFNRSDLLNFGRYCNLNPKKADGIISEVTGVFSKFPALTREWELGSALAQTIWWNLRRDI